MIEDVRNIIMTATLKFYLTNRTPTGFSFVTYLVKGFATNAAPFLIA